MKNEKKSGKNFYHLLCNNGTIKNYIPPLNCSLYGYPSNYYNYNKYIYRFDYPDSGILKSAIAATSSINNVVDYKLTGKVVDGNNNNVPIKNAVIYGWHLETNPNDPNDPFWKDFYFTYTRED